MLSMSVIVHCLAAFAAGLIAYFFIKYQKRFFLCQLSLFRPVRAGKTAPIHLVDRLSLIQFLAEILNTNVENEQEWRRVGIDRVDPGAIVLLHLSHGVSLLRCKHNQAYSLEIHVAAKLQNIDSKLKQRVERAFGKAVTVEFIEGTPYEI